jgi:hypothetical protein
VPVSNGESISTASAYVGARPAPHLFPAIFLSTGSPQNAAGYPHFVVVFHRLLHRSSTGYQALPEEHRVAGVPSRLISAGFPNSVSLFPRVNDRDYPAKFGDLSGSSPLRR